MATTQTTAETAASDWPAEHAATNIAAREIALLQVLQDIVMETMDYPVQKPMDSNSFLPEYLVKRAQRALGLYGMGVKDNAPAPEVAA